MVSTKKKKKKIVKIITRRRSSYTEMFFSIEIKFLRQTVIIPVSNYFYRKHYECNKFNLNVIITGGREILIFRESYSRDT